METTDLLWALLLFGVVLFLVLNGPAAAQSITGQSKLQTENGKEYLLVNVIFDRNDGETLVLVNDGEEVGGRVAQDEIRLSYSGISTFYEMPFTKREQLQCYELNLAGVPVGNPFDLGIDVYRPASSGFLLTKAAVNFGKNGTVAGKEITFDNQNKIVNFGNDAKFITTGIQFRAYSHPPDSADLLVVYDRTARRAYVVDKADFDAKLASWRRGRTLSSGDMRCYGPSITFEEVRWIIDMRSGFVHDVLSAARDRPAGDFGAKSFAFDLNSRKGRWFYDVGSVSLGGTVWIPTTMAGLVRYSAPQAKPSIVSFTLANVGPRTEQKFTVRNNGDTGTVFFRLDGQGSITVYPATFSEVIDAGQTKEIRFQSYKTQGDDAVCVELSAEADGGTDTERACARTTPDPAQETGLLGNNTPQNPLDLFDDEPPSEEDVQPGAPIPNIQIPVYVQDSFSDENPSKCSAIEQRNCGALDVICAVQKRFDLWLCGLEEMLNVAITTAVAMLLLFGFLVGAYLLLKGNKG